MPREPLHHTQHPSSTTVGVYAVGWLREKDQSLLTSLGHELGPPVPPSTRLNATHPIVIQVTVELRPQKQYPDQVRHGELWVSVCFLNKLSLPLASQKASSSVHHNAGPSVRGSEAHDTGACLWGRAALGRQGWAITTDSRDFSRKRKDRRKQTPVFMLLTPQLILSSVLFIY